VFRERRNACLTVLVSALDQSSEPDVAVDERREERHGPAMGNEQCVPVEGGSFVLRSARLDSPLDDHDGYPVILGQRLKTRARNAELSR
jgi:hypothetical protein